MKRVVFAAFAAAVLALIAAPSFAAGIAVTPAGPQAIKKAIAADRGRVVVVNFWATWCGPCVAEFPALVSLANDYKSQGLVVFAVSADSPRDLNTKVKPFLAEQHAEFRQFLAVSADPDDMIDAFDPRWQGDLPRTFIYDKSGKLVKELSGPQTKKSFSAAVRPFLAKR